MEVGAVAVCSFSNSGDGFRDGRVRGRSQPFAAASQLPARVFSVDTRGDRVERGGPNRSRRLVAGARVTAAFLAPRPAMVHTPGSTSRGDGDAPSGDADDIAVTPKVADGDVEVRAQPPISVDAEGRTASDGPSTRACAF